jgi:hypothetical protein
MRKVRVLRRFCHVVHLFVEQRHALHIFLAHLSRILVPPRDFTPPLVTFTTLYHLQHLKGCSPAAK